MLKYVLYTLLIVVIIVLGFYFSVKLPFQVIQGNISYSIRGCVGPSAEQIQPDKFNLSSIGNVVVITHSTSHSCCENLTMSQSIENNIIKITENFAGHPCGCYCSSDMMARIGSLENKKYTVNLYKNINGNSTLVASREITIFSQ